ncbi:MAG: LpqB family beta-propeller domain-containing protein, partial [Chloroflexota bacterium]|nr:LpqB family beta-propeller domain-containing protein [Chloroflexota bacterium]
QIPADEQPAASKLFSAAETMKVPPAFQWQLEAELMEAYKTKTKSAQNWVGKITCSVGWVLLAVCGVLLLSWAIRSVIPNLMPAEVGMSNPAVPFEINVRQGNICTGPLAVAHNFSVSLSNKDKTGFVTLDGQKTIGEIRSFAWSPDGKKLAIIGNTAGGGNIHLTDSTGDALQPVLSDSEIGYSRDAAWSPDGKQFVMWSSQNNSVVYLVNIDGTGLVEKQLDIQIFSTPQFSPNNESIIFYGANASSDGLFEVMLDGSQTRMINDLVEDESAFAFSPDGSRLAYVAMDRISGEAILMVHDVDTGALISMPGSLPIPKGIGSSIPESANLSWSQDGKALVFEFGRSQTDRAIYLAYVDGTELIKLADSAHAPAISADGNCLAYIRNKQVFLLDLMGISPTSIPGVPVLLAELPVGRIIADFRLDKLQWGPAPAQP